VIHHERDVREEQKYICLVQASNNKRDCDARSLLLLAAMVRSFAHMPLGISDRNIINLELPSHAQQHGYLSSSFFSTKTS